MISRFILTLCILGLVSCGGGGSDSGGGGRSAATGIRVLHGAIDASPVDLLSDVQGLVETVRFGESPLYGALSPGQQTITLTRALTPTSQLFSAPLNVAKNSRFTLLLYGNRESIGLQSALFADSPGEIPDQMSAVQVVHATVGAASVDALSDLGAFSSGIPFGQSSGYQYIPSGQRTLTVRRSADRQTVARVSALLEAGRSYTLFATGEIDYYVHAPLIED